MSQRAKGITLPEHFSPIAITGTGAIVPGAIGIDRYFANLLAARCFIRDVPAWLWPGSFFLSKDRQEPNRTYASIAALAGDPPFSSSDYKIPPATARLLSRSQKMAIQTAREALSGAGVLGGRVKRERFGVFVSAIAGGEIAEAVYRTVDEDVFIHRLQDLAATRGHGELFAALLEEYRRKHQGFAMTADALTGSTPNLVAGRIASLFDLRGPNFVLDAACASSLAALGCAINALQTGECEAALAGGVETWVDVHAFVQFSRLNALSAHGCFPFDERADGFVIGEGCGMVVLRRLEDARRDGDPVLAVIRGIGSSSDGADSPGITAPSIPGQVRAMRRAYEVAGIDPADIDYIEAHGTGTRLGDPTELASLQKLLQGSSKRKQDLPIASVKASVGHLRTAAGMAGLLNAMMVVGRRIIPPQVNFERPTSAFEWRESLLRVPTRPETIEREHPVAGVSSFGFGGINYHAVISAPDPGPIASRMVKTSVAVLPRVQRDVAFVFPGQGSQYVGMLGELRDTDSGRRLLSEADAIVLRLTGKSLVDTIQPFGFSDRASESEIQALQATELAQPAILLVSAIMLELVRARRIEPGMVLGHSLGEYAALYAAGTLSFASAIELVTRRGLLMGSPPDRTSGGMAYALTDRQTLEDIIRSSGAQVTIANVNAYNQQVVAGPLPDVRTFIDALRRAGIQSDRLAVDRAFHSPMVSRAVAPMRAVLETTPLFAPRFPIPANISGRVYPWRETAAQHPLTGRERNDVIDLLCRQIDQPVDFVSQIEAAYAAGIRRFVEIGPRAVLRGLIDEILQGKPFQVIALDDRSGGIRSRIQQLPRELANDLAIPRRPLPDLKPPDLAARPAGERPASGGSLRDRIRTIVSDVTGYEPSKLGDDVLLDRDLGIDSLSMVAMAARLRGTILPEDFTGFRHLTSVNKIAALAEGPRTTAPRKAARFACYLNTEQPAHLPDTDSCGTAFASQPAFTWKVGTAEELCLEAIPALSENIQRFAAREKPAGRRPRLAVVTFGPDRQLGSAWFRAFRGFILSASRELPEVTFAYHHIDAEEPSSDFIQRVSAADGIGQRWRSPDRVVATSLQELEPMPEGGGQLDRFFTAQDRVLVTGGARGIAAACVQSLLKKTGARFVLIGRSGEPEPWVHEAGRDRVEYLAADVADIESLRRTGLDQLGITMILHAAGLAPLTPFRQKSGDEIRQVMKVKALGLVNVLRVVPAATLRGIVSFSSIVAHFGNLAQQDYAAANGFLDGFVAESGVPHLSIGWTAWSGTGMASRGLVKDVLETSGIDFLPTSQGVRWFEDILAWWLSRERAASTVVEIFAGLGRALDKSPENPEPEAQERSLPEHVVLLNPGGYETPIFGICGIYGYAYRLQLIARELPSSIPLYAMEPPHMDWTSAGCSRLEEMAEFYANTIERCRKTGPVGLLGTSFGGNMAFEVAKLLQARGRTVSFLALVDTMPPDEDPLEHDKLGRVINRKLRWGRDPARKAAARLARIQLDALRNADVRGRFEGAIHYFLMSGLGWPGRFDRRFSWEALATGGLQLLCLPGVHGEFAADHARRELAGGLAAMVQRVGGVFLDPEDYFRKYGIDGRMAGKCQPAPRKVFGFGSRVTWCIRFRNRLWIRGRIGKELKLPATVGVVCDGQLMHSSCVRMRKFLAAYGSFEMVVDFYRVPDLRKPLQVLVWNADTCWHIGTLDPRDYFNADRP